MSRSKIYIFFILLFLGAVCMEAESPPANKLYVGNLSWSTTDESLKQAFSDYGTIVDSIVMKDRETGRSRGFGFVTFETADSAEAAVNGMNDKDLEGRRVKVSVARAKGQQHGQYGGDSYGGESYRGGYGPVRMP